MARQASNYQISAFLHIVQWMTLLSLETPGPYPIQEGIYTSFYISVSEPLMYTGFPLYEAKFYFLLLTSLMSI